MSKEYIEREVISEGIRKYYYKNPPNSSYGEGFDRGLDRAQRAILDAPAADVAPVRHGMWETIDASTWRWSHDGAKPVHRVKYRHNECGRVVQRKEPYCPNCGCKMDLEG